MDAPTPDQFVDQAFDLSRARPAPRRVEDLDTPAVVVDLDVVERNLARWQAFCDERGLANRPHVKTHKLIPLAKRQIALGAQGVTCQKLGEAEVMADAGIDDILITYNLLGAAKLGRLAALAGRARVGVVADDATVVDGLSDALSHAGVSVRVLVECDTGGRRCGVVSPEDAAGLAERIARKPGLAFGGLMTYPAAGLRREAAAFFEEARALCARSGIAVETVSSGGSPDLWSTEGLGPLTEYRAGTYVYMDRALVARGVAILEDCATTVLATVVSRPTADRAVIDAGSKSLSSDLQGQSGFGTILEAPLARIAKLNEEHGTVDLTQAPGALGVGDRVRVLPNHVCVVSNLVDEVYLARGGEVICAHPVDARGRVT